MVRPLAHRAVARPLLRGICLVVTGEARRADRAYSTSAAAGASNRFPRRPDGRVLSETIPLFFVGRNKNRLWVVREAEGRAGGVFLFKRSALRFATRYSAPIGCATMFLSERFELDVANQGDPLVAGLDAVLRVAARRACGFFALVAAAAAAVQHRIIGEHR